MNRVFSNTMLLATVILMDVLGGAELDLFVPSFTELQAQFNLTPVLVEWLLSLNFIGFGISLFVVGVTADRYGRKPVILTGLSVFIAGSILCLFSASYCSLLLGRFIQGIGAAAPASLCFIIIADQYSIKKQQFFSAMLNCITNISVGLAPVAGSYITKYFHWQGNFIVLLFLAIFTFLMTIIFIPNTKSLQEKEQLSPLSYLKLFRSKNFMLLVCTGSFMFVPYWVFSGISPILYMKDLGVSLTSFGYYQGFATLIFAFGSLMLGFVVKKSNQFDLLKLSKNILILGIFSMVLLAVLEVGNPKLIVLGIMPYNIAAIVPSFVLYPIVLSVVPGAKAKASAIIQVSRLAMSAIGLELAGYFYSGTVRSVAIVMAISMLISLTAFSTILKDKKLLT
jgi:MFS transporter, DHA1 family, multidrug resistance protein